MSYTQERSDEEQRGASPLTFSSEFIRAAMTLLDPEFVLSKEAEAHIVAVMSRRAAGLVAAKMSAR